MGAPRLPRLATLLLSLAWPALLLADIAVIVHPDSPVFAVSAREVSDLYLGRSRSIGVAAQRVPLEVIEQPANSPLRANFFRALNGMDIRQVNAYWARLQFSGAVLPPPVLEDSQAVMDAVSRNPRGIGYIDAARVNRSVRTVLLLKE